VNAKVLREPTQTRVLSVATFFFILVLLSEPHATHV
jgi:hypothetical protein